MAKMTSVNDGVDIVVWGGPAQATYAAPERNRIQKAIRESLLRSSKEPYHKVEVAVQQRKSGTPQALVAFMLRAHTYTADVVRLDVARDYGVRSFACVSGEEEYWAATAQPAEPTPRRRGKFAAAPDMVFGTPVPEIATAKKGVDYACQIAAKAGFKVVKLLGADANVANYRKYLSGNLKAFGNIGHGYTGGIVLADGNLSSAWFAGLPKKALWPEVVYFNSCQVFNAPLLPAIEKAGVRTFIGGKVNLLIGSSEEVFKCFWTKVLRDGKKMGDSLTTCENQLYPQPGSHGIKGDLGKF